MGGGESREEKKLEGLPLVKKRYKMVSILGQGNFGGVYKVQHKKNKRFYALKCVPVDAREGTNENQQKVVYQTALTEKKILKSLKHANIVRLIDSFIVPHNPAEKKPKKKKGKKTRFFCLLLEYCHGNTLEAVLQKVEENKELKNKPKRERQTKGQAVKKKEDKNKEKEPTHLFIPKDLCLIWFIKLLETVAYVHSKKIIHCDLHPENILLKYRSINDYKNIDLKLSDFGVAKDISKELPRDLSGQIFYASPESVNQKRYDTRTDIEELVLDGCNKITSDQVKKFNKLRVLKIDEKSYYEDPTIKLDGWIGQFKNLENIALIGTKKPTKNFWDGLGQIGSSIRKFVFIPDHNTGFSNVNSILQKMGNLEVLELRGNYVELSPEGLEKTKDLRHLVIYQCSRATRDAYERLPCLRNCVSFEFTEKRKKRLKGKVVRRR